MSIKSILVVEDEPNIGCAPNPSFKRAGDSIIGQIQRYMASVEEDFAKNNEKVSGLIIAFEDDPKIRKTLRRVPNVHFYQYKIHFELKKLKT